MERKNIIQKLVAEGMTEKTLANLNDMQLFLLADRMLSEQLKKGSIVMSKGTTSTSEIDKYTRAGQNVELREKLIGGQTKLDKNKNGKLDAQDFKMLGKKSKYEFTEQDVYDDNNDEMEPVSAKREFLKDLQNDTDFIEFKKRTQFDDNGYKGSFGTPSVQKDFYIDKIKYGRVGDKNFNPEKYSDEDELFEAKKKPSAGLSSKKKSEVAKAARAGKDIGKKGKGFEKIVRKAKQSGAKNPKAVAAAAMWKNIPRESKLKENKEVQNWLIKLVENQYHPLTSKGEIMELIQSKMSIKEKENKMNGELPDFMTFDAIMGSDASVETKPATPVAPSKPKTTPRDKPGERPKPRNPFQPGPGKDPKPKAFREK